MKFDHASQDVDLDAMETIPELERHEADAASAHTQQNLELAPGAVFADRYTIEEVIGRGGMGVVYKAQDALTEETVALKLIRPGRLEGKAATRRLISEGTTARDIRHPNVIAVYDVGEVGGQPYLSMEYLQGQSLRAWHRHKIQHREDVPLKITSRIIIAILEGLKAAHVQGVIHRDLKPENIFLLGEPSEDNVSLKILDFGIARALSRALDSGTGTGLGTPRYMAPEQVTAPDTVGPSADLYSLSIMFYELLVDVLPQGHWQPPSNGRPDVPTGIDELIENGLSNRPANRPQSSGSYLSSLRAALNDGGKVNPPTWLSSIFSTRGLGAIAAAGVVIIGLSSVFWLDRGGPGNVDLCEGLSGADLWDCRGLEYPASAAPDLATVLTNRVEPRKTEPNEPIEIIPEKPKPVVRAEIPETPKPVIRPVTPVPASRAPGLSILTGNWNDGLGTIYDMNINDSGQFSGAGLNQDGIRIELAGQINGQQGSYIVAVPQIGVAQPGQLRWRGDCHIDFQTYDPSGTYVIVSGQFHVNHYPGEPCPQ